VISSGLVLCALAITQVDSGHVNVYGDYRLASDPNTIVFAVGKLGITHANAIVQNSQVGFRGQVVTSSNIDQIAYYAYDGVITSPTGGTSGSATNLPTWGSDLTKPGTPAVAANGLGQTAASVSAAGATSSTGPVTYQWVKGSVGDAGSAMTPVAGQTSLSATIPLTAGVLAAIRLKATDAFPSTPGVQYSNELPLRPYAGLDLVVAALGDSITGNPQTWTDTSQGGSLAGSTSLAAEIGNILPALLDRRAYIVNQGIAGAKTTDWRTDAPGGGGNYLNAAIAAYNAQCTAVGYVGTKYATVLLGANDAINNIAASAYQANLTNICAGLIAAGITPILVPPTWAADRTPTSNAIGSISQKALLVDYPAVLPAVVAAALGTKLLNLPWLHSLIAANTAAWQTDGLHPSAEGVHQTAGAIARGIANLISPGGPSGFRGILTGGGM
jgi:lysophospholipase L1-like esterase